MIIEHKEPFDIYCLTLGSHILIYPRDMEAFESDQFYILYNKEPRKKLKSMRMSRWCITGHKIN